MARQGGSTGNGNGGDYYGQDAPQGQGYGASPYDRQGQASRQANPYGQDPYARQGQGQAASQRTNPNPYDRQAAADPRGAGARQASPYAQPQQGAYQQQPSYPQPQQQSPYAGGPYGQQVGAGSNPNPYANPYADPYAQPQQQRAARGRAGRAERNVASYPAGSGRVYESSRGPVGRAAGVMPVTGQEYRDERRYGPAVAAAARTPMDRRKFLAIAGGAAAAAVFGVAGVAWYTHRAVACTVNGTPREAPVGSTAAEIIKRGYASPSPGNLVSICNEDETPEVLTVGGGDPYKLTVNGAEVDLDTYRLGENDVLVFENGGDVTEPVTTQNTEIPCGIQLTSDGMFLVSIGYVKQWGRNGISSVDTGTVSGKVVDRGVTQEAQDLIITHSGVNPADGRKLIALTFDDGPDLDYTPQYLDILAKYGAKATFFNLGSQVDINSEYAALSKRCADEGHQVASHTYSHSNLLELDDASRNEEISKSFTSVVGASGQQMNVIRPPYGNFYASSFLAYLRAGGNIAYSAYWGVDSEDWRVASQGYGVEDGGAQIVANCTQNLTADSYNGAIVLMHDAGGDRTRDVAALPTLIETYQAQGYELVTLNELLQSDPTFPEWVSSGYATVPEGCIIPDASAAITYI